MKKLWDYEHPYSMQGGCYFDRDCSAAFASFEEFLVEWGDLDPDLNRVHRWDFNDDRSQVDIYFVMQRKAYTYSCHVAIKPEDHDRIKEFLKPHAEYNRKLWEGV